MEDQASMRSGAQPPSEKVYQVAVVGCGAISERAHLPALSKMTSRFSVATLVDTDTQRTEELAEQYAPGASRLSNYEGLAGRAEVALVATPPHTHQRIVCSLLEQGLHVLVEKPLARTREECETIAEAARASGRSVFVGYNRRYFLGWRFLKVVSDSNLAGPLLSLDAEEGSPFDWPVGSAAIFNPEIAGGGTMLDTGVHELDLVLWLASEKPRVLFYEDDNRGGVEANGHAILADGDRTFRLRLSRTHTLQNRVVANFLNAVITVECWDPTAIDIFSWDPVVERSLKKAHTDLRQTLGADPTVEEWTGVWNSLQSGVWFIDEAAIQAIDLLGQMYSMRQPMDQPWVGVARELEGVR